MPNDQSSRSGNQGAAAPSFPQSSAFVLQFAAEAGPDTGLFRGRIQHIASGEQTSFQSTDELWAFVRGVLSEPESEPPDPDDDPSVTSVKGTDDR